LLLTIIIAILAVIQLMASQIAKFAPLLLLEGGRPFALPAQVLAFSLATMEIAIAVTTHALALEATSDAQFVQCLASL
jgi:hypothetical protein